MQSALWVSKTGLAAQDTALRAISNNLANVSTVGFKKDRVVFEDLMYQVQEQPGALSTQNTTIPSGTQLGTGVRVAGTQKSFEIGSIQTTNNDLDVAISGNGFLQVAMPDGSLSYTRNGQLHLDQDGQIVTAHGYVIEPAITVPADAIRVSIGRDGTVSATQRGNASPVQIGTIQLATFVNAAGLEAIGSNLFIETAASGAAQQSTPGENGAGELLSGSLESSNVSVVEEMVNMVATQRAYEMNSKVITTADQMLQFVTQNL
ncbi:MAG: flagellar basal-body rod protein FlgG [Pseudomonadales bacterium]|nr:flagellar basal-body rod protein FlgG [Pseudomonadales bacterium]MCP5184728.1 flagellar basal-body rod protein FlgG [Pseudomonadales bacterium]